MVHLIAACIGSVMHLSSGSYRLSLDVPIASFAAAMASVCLAVSRLSHLSVHRCDGCKHLFLHGDSP